MAARTMYQVALEDMRRPGFPSPYSSSYAPNQVRPLGRRAGGGSSIQYVSASLVMGRYADARAFTSTNPDFGSELSYLGSQIPTFQARSWNRILPWNHVWLTDEYGLAGRAINTRIVFFGWEVWLRSVASGQWNRIIQTDSWTGVPAAPNFSTEDWSMTWRDFRTEPNGHQSVRVMLDPNSPTAFAGAGYWAWHGWAGGVTTFNASDLADVFVVARVTKVRHDVNAADDRDAARYAIAIGADYYPEPRDVFYPSVGISRHRDIRAKWPEWELIVMHTMTEAQLGQFGVPPALAGLSENYDPGGTTPPPPVEVIPAGPAPTKGRWVSIYNPSSPKGRWTSIGASGNVAPSWGSESPVTATIGVAFSFTPPLAAGTPAPTFSKVSGPSWASVNTTTGAVTGTPTGSPTTATVVVRATNTAGTADYGLQITVLAASAAVAWVTPATLPGAVVGQPWQVAFEFTGDAPVAVALTSGSLPAGTQLLGFAVSGTPSSIGSGTFTLTLSNPYGPSAARAFSWNVAAAGSSPVITTASLPAGTVGVAYLGEIRVTGDQPIVVGLAAGALPPGLGLFDGSKNKIRNPAGAGAVAGTPGTLPTYWSLGTNGSGLSTQVVGTGTEDGFDYVDVRFFGTASVATEFFVLFEQALAVTAANAQTWSGSCYVRRTAGSNAALTAANVITRGVSGAGAGLTVATGANVLSLLGAASLGANRASATVATASASTAAVQTYLRVSHGTGAINITLRIAAPQLEQASAPTYFADPRFWYVAGTPLQPGGYFVIAEAANGIGQPAQQSLSISVVGAGGASTAASPWTRFLKGR